MKKFLRLAGIALQILILANALAGLVKKGK